ncbi:hypothetical protein [Pseudonocardia adelaidensis]|uniref:Uncharacterized protein n=1 Tax=Pseudonocardia adelaidensis TaxID=648754 RepID=A0ABP9NS83_9PSEU
MIDGGVIAAYLAAAVARGGRRVPDRVVDGTLDRLTDRVARRLGPRPAAELAKNPYDGATLAEASRAIGAVARHDVRFARELAGLRRKLDKHGGLRLADQVRARAAVRAFHVSTGDRDVRAEPVVGQGAGRVLALVGILVALTGFACWMYVIVSGFAAGPAGPVAQELVVGVPPAPAAFGAFLAGVLMFGSGAAFTMAARRREQEDLRWAAGRRRR